MTDEAGALTVWQGRPVEEWRERWGVPILRIHSRVGSTNDLARELAEGGAPEGTVVMADEQTRGRGRRGRAWTAPAGSSLLLSMVLRPRAPQETVLPLRIGLAVAGAIEAVAPVDVRVKWPNDLFIGGRKAAGLLCEAARVGGRTAHVVAGVGINVLQPASAWPPEIAGTATSVAAEAGGPVALPALAERVIAATRSAGDAAGPLGPDELEALARRDLLRGRAVRIDGHPAGVARGVDSDGALVVEQAGVRTRIFNGTVRLAEEPRAAGSDTA